MLATAEDLQTALDNPADFDSTRAQLLIELATAEVQSMSGGQRILEVVDDSITIMALVG